MESRRWLIVLGRPVLAAVERHCNSAVVGSDHSLSILRIDPQPVIVAVRKFELVKQMSAVGRLVGVHVHDVENVLVPRIGDHVHVVPRPLPQTVVGIHQLPRLAAVIGPVQSAIRIVCLDQRVHALRIRRHRYADLSVWALRKSVLFEMLPGRSAVG
jgi:hypothetical protein